MLYLAPLNLGINSNQIVFARQFKGHSTVVYDLELVSKDLSKSIRAKYGTFWRKRNRPTMPGALQGISISNSLTFSTRVRIAILKEIAKRHTESNPGLQCFVTNYLPRPTLKLKDKGPVKTFGYVEAIKRFGHHLTPAFLTSQTRFAKTNVPVDELLPTFLVLTPDLLATGATLDVSMVSNPADVSSDQAMDDQEVEGQSTSPSTEALSTKTPSGKGSKRKAGKDQQKATSKKAATSYFG